MIAFQERFNDIALGRGDDDGICAKLSRLATFAMRGGYLETSRKLRDIARQLQDLVKEPLPWTHDDGQEQDTAPRPPENNL